jgi:glutaminase
MLATGFRSRACRRCSPLTLALGKLGDGVGTGWARTIGQSVQFDRSAGAGKGPAAQSVHQCRRHRRGGSGSWPAISRREAIGEILRFIRHLADDDSIVIDELVARSETAHGDRNASLAHFMKSFGCIDHPVDHVLGVYFHQCAIAMNCQQLCACRTVSGQRRPRSGDRRAGDFANSARGASMRSC